MHRSYDAVEIKVLKQQELGEYSSGFMYIRRFTKICQIVTTVLMSTFDAGQRQAYI